MGIKERRTKILLALKLFQTDPQSFVDIDPRIQLIFDLSMNQKTKSTLNSMLKESTIEKSESGNQYRLTDTGKQALYLEFPFFRFLESDWDRKWRILSYEIPEKKRELRDKLRREVAGWGLGPWHRSFWITPHPIISNLQHLISQKEEEQYVQAFESEHVFGNREILIEKVWETIELDKKYRALFKFWHEILSSSIDKNEKFRKVIGEYIGVLRVDPGLPVQLVGEKWIGQEAFNIFREIKGILMT